MLKQKRYRKKIKKWIINSAEKPFLSVLKKELSGCKSVLDIGCGVNSSLGKIPKKFYSEGIDAFFGEKKPVIYDRFKKGNITNLRKYYKKKSFDAVIAIDVIEHLKKGDGIKFLRDLEWIAREKIIILTPSGFMYQGPVGGNPFQVHLSGWNAKDFKKYGYKTYGMHGLKILRGELAGIKFKPWYIWLFISHLTQFITVFFPKIAFHILAVKTLNNDA